MALRNIRIEGEPVLRKHCRPVEKVDDHIREILDDMLETMRDAYGVGIAAPQVGVLRRMFVAEPDPESGEVFYMVNPEILEMSGSEEGDEGCLSVPGYAGTVERPTYVKIRALDRDGSERIVEANGFAARVMCHEYDHLEGILYIDKAQNLRRTDEEEEGAADEA